MSHDTASDPVDIEGFRSTMREAGIEEIVEPTLALFAQEAENMFDRVARSVARGHPETIREHAHALKSASANIRAVRLASALEELEIAARQNDDVRIEAGFARVEPEYHAVVKQLAEHAS